MYGYNKSIKFRQTYIVDRLDNIKRKYRRSGKYIDEILERYK